MKIDVLTLFPEMFGPVVGSSILGRAGEKGILEVRTTDIRDFSNDKHNKADDYPFGGGGGMVMMADPIFGALESIDAKGKKIIYMSPRGKILDSEKINELAALDDLVILCGHYEGVDQRVIDYWDMEEISIGDYVLTGGELPAMVMIDAISRLIPGVLHNDASAEFESFQDNLLEYPQYTRPEEWHGKKVPEVLLSGHHVNIEKWRREQSLKRTLERRPDLLEDANLTKNDKKYLQSLQVSDKI